MFRKAVIVFFALSLMVGMSFASELVPLEPVKVPTHRGPVIGELNELDDLFVLRRYTSDAEYYLGSGSQDDTMLVVFQPLAACSVYFGQQQWYSGGSYRAFMWEYNDACEENVSANGRAVPRGTSTESPLGAVIFGPYNNTAEGSGDWENLFGPDDLPGGGIWREDNSMFGIGWVKTQDDGMPQPLADNVSARGFTYTWFGGPWMEDYDNYWGSYSSDFSGTIVDLMIRAQVSYPEGAPPIIGSMNQLPNTISTDKTCTVECDIVDDDGWTTDTADLKVSVNGGDPTTIAMTDDNGDEIFQASFSLGDLGVSLGDVVQYWIEATDNEDGFNSNVDDQLNFEIVELSNPTAGVLVIDDGLDDPDVLYTYLEERWLITYEWWDIAANKGLDSYTVEGGDWDLVIVGGWGTTTVPTRDYGDDPYSAWLETAGNNLLYCDQDYFYTNGEDETPTFSAGDFAYDIFGISAGVNDPSPTDSAFYGIDGDALSGDFVNTPYAMLPTEIDGNLDGLWTDFATPAGGATGFFEGENIGDVAAVYKDGDNKVACFLFDFFWAVELDSVLDDTTYITYYRGNEQFVTLMDNLMGWYGFDTGVEEEGAVATPTEYSLSQNYPNPFNPSTQISFNVPNNEMVTLKVFNVEGREVATLFQGHTQGQHAVTFDATDLASGVYFYRLEAGSFTQTNRMILLK